MFVDLSFPFSLLNFLSSFAKNYFFNDSTLYLAPYLGIIFPNILFLQALEEIRTYETLGSYLYKCSPQSRLILLYIYTHLAHHYFQLKVSSGAIYS